VLGVYALVEAPVVALEVAAEHSWQYVADRVADILDQDVLARCATRRFAFHAPEICLTERSSGGMMAQEPSLSLRMEPVSPSLAWKECSQYSRREPADEYNAALMPAYASERKSA